MSDRQPTLPSRRQVLAGVASSLLTTAAPPRMWASAVARHPALRSINVMNFIRADEPREPMDLLLPVTEQMRVIKQNNLPATWLLQYDALVQGPFVEFLKAEMPTSHEVGIWFEMNRRICDDARVAWRGRPDWEWDYHVPIAYAIGYTPDERRKLADTAMATFKRTFGTEAKSVASWNLDAVTVAHLAEHYGIDAFGNCRDQLATDGFTIWGAPIAAYYPARDNAWSPAVSEHNQISSPIFRLLGQDPVYYYDKVLPYPDTIEPVWASGKSPIFVERFLAMIADSPTQQIAYAQLGQENSFGWPAMQQAYPMQMEALARLRGQGSLHVETMGETGRRFKQTFRSTPTQAQVMLQDPFGHTDPAERTIWYQSRFYRANLHVRDQEFYLRDLHVYNDLYPQPYLSEPVRIHGIDQRMLAVLDGYHWSDGELGRAPSGERAKGSFLLRDSQGRDLPLHLAGEPTVSETDSELTVTLPLAERGGTLQVRFSERAIRFTIRPSGTQARLLLRFTWNAERSALHDVSSQKLSYVFRDFAYSVTIHGAVASGSSKGVDVLARSHSPVTLSMVQGGA